MDDRRLEERTEQPSAHRREEARERGEVTRSRDLTVALSLLGALVALHFAGPGLLAGARSTATCLLAAAGTPAALTPDGTQALVAAAAGFLLSAVLPIAAASCGMAAAAAVLQGGLALRADAVQASFGRLNPFAGARRMVGARSLGRGAFAVLKIAIVAWIGARGVAGLILPLSRALSLERPGAGTGLAPAAGAWKACWQAAISLGLQLSLALAGLALLEYGFQKWRHERELRMTRAEVREEIHRLEGSSELRRERRAVLQTRFDAPGAEFKSDGGRDSGTP